MNIRRGLIRLFAAWTMLWNAGWIALCFWADFQARRIGKEALDFIDAVHTNNWITTGAVSKIEYENVVQTAESKVDLWRSIADQSPIWGCGVYLVSIAIAVTFVWVCRGFRKS